MMDSMPLIPFLGSSVPESLILYYMVLVLVGQNESLRFIISLSLITSLFSYIIRAIPMIFGIHSILQVILMVILLNSFLKLPWLIAFAVMILSSVILGLTEGIFVPFLAWVFSLELQQILTDPLLRMLFTLPHVIFLAVLTHMIRKRQFRVPLIARILEVNCETAKRTRKQQTYLIALCLIQALMLVLLKISFYAYSSSVYISLTLDNLVEISIFVLMVAALATIFVANYLLQVIEREARLETELHYVRERHNLNLRVQVERHDFYNHLTAIYGYVKEGHYAQAEAYIGNLYETVRHIESLLKIYPPELAAILSVKQEEAKTRGIRFHWKVNVEGTTLPLSPEDLTHLTGNLLDNALDAAKANCTPIVDLSLTCNKLGLELTVSNNGNPIPQSYKQNIYILGYTTKDVKQHSGLGLYIIQQIIDRYDGQLELKEPENYSGVEFVAYIPWRN
ncbi:sensor histidine kinase [Desulfosporosinus fructosivorans]|nr:ATP-binding protein [Desulfosporosinus fructosivorans]